MIIISITLNNRKINIPDLSSVKNVKAIYFIVPTADSILFPPNKNQLAIKLRFNISCARRYILLPEVMERVSTKTKKNYREWRILPQSLINSMNLPDVQANIAFLRVQDGRILRQSHSASNSLTTMLTLTMQFIFHTVFMGS